MTYTQILERIKAIEWEIASYPMPVKIDVESEFLTGLFETFEKQRTVNVSLERELHNVIKENERLIANDKRIRDILKEIEMKLGKHKIECLEVLENNA